MDGAVTGQTKSQMRKEIEQLKREVDSVSKSFTELTQKLQPILRQETPQEECGDKKLEEKLVLYAQEIKDEGRKIRNLSVEISRVKSRVEL